MLWLFAIFQFFRIYPHHWGLADEHLGDSNTLGVSCNTKRIFPDCKTLLCFCKNLQFVIDFSMLELIFGSCWLYCRCLWFKLDFWINCLTLLSVLSVSLIWRVENGIPSLLFPVVIVVLDESGTTWAKSGIELYFMRVFLPEHLSPSSQREAVQREQSSHCPLSEMENW